MPDLDSSFIVEDLSVVMEESNESGDEQTEQYVPNNDSKFIVFWSCLVPSLSLNSTCFSPAEIVQIATSGLMLKGESNYSHKTEWYPCPRVRKMSLGNLELWAALLYSGNSFTRIQEMMSLCRVSFMWRTSVTMTFKRSFCFQWSIFFSKTPEKRYFL